MSARFGAAKSCLLLLVLLGHASGQGVDLFTPTRRSADAAMTRLLEPVVEPSRRFTVQVMGDGQPKALGTVVSSDGLIVTKWTEVEGQSLGVVLSDKTSYRARLLGVDRDTDLALLRISASGLAPADWAAASHPVGVGQWVAAPLAAGDRFALGVISARRRKVQAVGGVMGVKFTEPDPYSRRDPNAMPGEIENVVDGSGAAAAGLRKGDVITCVQGQPTPLRIAVVEAVNRHGPGETIRITYRRDDRETDTDVILGERTVIFPRQFTPDRMQTLNGQTSKRRNGFVAVLEHHIVLTPSQCGGPLINLDGKVVGVNIARVNRSESYALPSDIVQQSIQKLLKQSPQPSP